MTRRGSPRPRGRRLRTPVAIVCLALTLTLFAPTFVTPHAAYSTAELDRGSDLFVVADADGGVGITSYHKLNTGETCKLVTVTNNFESQVTVSVELRDDSTKYGNLTLGDGREGNQATFQLGAGNAQDVGLETKADSSFDDDNVFYHVDITDSPVLVTADDRYSTIDNDQVTTDCDITL